MKNKITDVDLVRWAHVRVLMNSPNYKSALDDDVRDIVAHRIIDKLLTASPKELSDMLGVDDQVFIERVHSALRKNEETRPDKQKSPDPA